MTVIQEFDLLQSPLQGTNLIEASAGTGKTYTITALYVRLLLERGLSVDRILVVTFTEAATGELRERIRDKLKQAAEVLSGGESDDAFLNALALAYRHSEFAAGWLKTAIRDFDQAAIFTIHGFCRRILHESAFESGSLFDTELITDQQEFKREIVEDFWRKNFYRTSPLFFNYAASRHVSPESLLSSLGNRIGQPFLKVIPATEIPDTSRAEKAFRDLFAELAGAWPAVREEVAEILSSHAGLNRSQYKVARVSAWVQAMESYLSADLTDPLLWADFEKFTAGKICGAMKKGHSPPEHQLFQLCDKFKNAQQQLVDLFEQRLLGLKSALFAFAGEQLGSRKQDRNVQSFDDLLLNLYAALQQGGGHELAGAVRAKFSAALIDEFQDTDPLQYAIFKKLFDNANTTLFLIGDPKQAIYGFRGADIFAYMEAANYVQNRYTLGKNWRSDPALISAVNAIFSNAKRPFIYDRIPFLPVVPGRAESRKSSLKFDDRLEPPLQLWLLDAGRLNGSGKAVSKTDAQKLIPKAVAAEISRLLSLAAEGKASVAGKVLKAGDIAVLVRKNVEARLMQKALSELRIPAVLYSNANLFDSYEAVELERLLSGLVEPNNERLLKAALTTEVIGLRGEQLDRMQTEDETGWEFWLIKFREYHDRWAAGGFMRMFKRLLRELDVLERLMALPDGERRITNVLHLAEVLQQKSAEKKLNMAAMVKWLSDQRDPGSLRPDEHQLRLESDENAVKLVTVHKSKGLEYPIVFCPFTWDGSKIKRTSEPFVFHDESGHMELTLDLGSPQADANRAQAEKEMLAENIRLLYVALTRARNRCYLVWGRFNEAETSAPAYVLHAPEPGGSENTISALAEKFNNLSDQDFVTELKKIEARADEAIQISPMPDGAGEIYAFAGAEDVRLACRTFNGTIDRQWRVSSFSSLVSGQPHRAELADRDEFILPDREGEGKEASVSTEQQPLSIFAFPRGAAAGILLHEIFERIDFTKMNDPELEQQVAAGLRQHRFELKWQNTLCKMFRDVLSAPLDPVYPELKLCRIDRADRLNEMQFYFPLKPISSNELKEIFAGCADLAGPADFAETVGRLNFSPARGFMKGFIDLIFQFDGRFYLVDWKSNFLGSRIEDYHADALKAAMAREMYVLQYHIYALALHQYLKLRLPGYDYALHFGGVYYLFLRGMSPEAGSDYGIYRDRPRPELIETLCARLIGSAK